jgi:hypothetical protein
LNKRIKNIPPVKRKSGRRPFIPTDEQRRTIERLAAMRVPWDEMRLLIASEYTGRPIAKTSFSRIFKKELEAARTQLKELVARKFLKALEDGAPWAIRLSLRNVYSWAMEGSQPLQLAEDNSLLVSGLNVRFVLPDKRPEEPAPPIDVSPSGPPDYSRPALPAPSYERVKGPNGAVWRLEDDESGKGWMR